VTTNPKPGRMVYDFGDKRDACYEMYINQNKTIGEIAEYYKQFNFTPRYVACALRKITSPT